MERKARVKIDMKETMKEPAKPSETPLERFAKNLNYNINNIHRAGHHYFISAPIDTDGGVLAATKKVDKAVSGLLAYLQEEEKGLTKPNYSVKLKTLLFNSRKELSDTITNTLVDTKVQETLSRKNLIDVKIEGEKIELYPMEMSNEDIQILINVITRSGKSMHWLPILQDILWQRWGWKKTPQVKKKVAKKPVARAVPRTARRNPWTVAELDTQRQAVIDGSRWVTLDLSTTGTSSWFGSVGTTEQVEADMLREMEEDIIRGIRGEERI
jgi:hypothetical protein